MDEFDLVTDMESADWFVDKVADLRYAQNLYAALCNNDFQKQAVWEVLTNSTWSCSWRSAGGIVADLRKSGEDYLDFYCSGIRNADYSEEINKEWNNAKYVSEGTITQEIADDLLRLGWAVVTSNK